MDMLDKIQGTVLGTAVGDALGMPVEGWKATDIAQRYGEIREMLPARLGRGTYTDDTQMMIALADSLVRCQSVDGEDIASTYVKFCDPRRGYGGGAFRSLQRIQSGISWRESGKGDFPEGSFGNGGAMRIAPIGVLYGAGDVKQLREAVEAAVYCTHTHPLGIDGAVFQARAIGIVAQMPSDADRFPLDVVLSAIHDAVLTNEFHQALSTIKELLQTPDIPIDDVIHHLGNGIAALEAAPAALYAFLSHVHRFEDAVVYAIGLGGDTDTIGAMTGALSGAYHGASHIPSRWLDSLEDGEHGKTYMIHLAQELFRIFSVNSG